MTVFLMAALLAVTRAAFRYGYYRGRLDEFLKKPDR